jgi:hypothetical protein
VNTRHRSSPLGDKVRVNRRRLFLWIGLILVLALADGFLVALFLLPPTFEAPERIPVPIREGMTLQQVLESDEYLRRLSDLFAPDFDARECKTTFPWRDSSIVIVRFDADGRVDRLEIFPRPVVSVSPLTRMQRTLAHVLPFLGE